MPKTDATLREDASIFEMLAEYGGWIVVIGVGIEFVLAFIFRGNKSFAEAWGPVIANALVVGGVMAEVLFAKLGNETQEELDRRSNEKLAEAMLRATKAELDLATFRTPRRGAMTPAAVESITAKLKLYSGTHFDTGLAGNSGEQADFLWDLSPALTKAGWVHEPWSTVYAGQPRIIQGDRPASGQVAAANVEIHLHPEKAAELKPAATALIDALNSIGVTAAFWDGESGMNVHNANPIAIHIAIGEKR